MASPTKITILSPHTLARAAWSALLSQQAQLQVAGTAASIDELESHREINPSAILIDVTSGQLAFAQQLTTTVPGAGQLFLVDEYELNTIVPLLRAGTLGCISRNSAVTDLARSLIAVGRGEVALPPHIAGQALALLARGAAVPGGLIEPLSERETEVLRLLADGLTNKDIAQTLVLSVRTVEAHLRNVYGKLDMHSRTEAALWAVKNGYASDAS